MSWRLPIVMTYVINFGVPPLLFAQVLYGRALYTSSVLIGAYWIAVIGLLMACYWLLYRFAARLQMPAKGWWMGIGAWVLAAAVARIYASNMTLMLRPEVWQSMYAAAANGAQLPAGDPSLAARWLFFVAGGVMTAGLWMIYLAARSSVPDAHRPFLAVCGGQLAAVMAVAEWLAARNVLATQPAAVLSELAAKPLFAGALYGWCAALVLIAALGIVAAIRRSAANWMAWGAAAAGFLAMAALAVYRDGLRDLTLLSKGFDVWDRTVVTNWSVVVLFLVLFVAGLGAVGWLVSVMSRATRIKEVVS